MKTFLFMETVFWGALSSGWALITLLFLLVMLSGCADRPRVHEDRQRGVVCYSMNDGISCVVPPRICPNGRDLPDLPGGTR